MSSTTRVPLLTLAIEEGVVDLVGINEVKFLEFRRPAPREILSLGAQGLSACSIIVVASDKAAIVAHIGPNIPDSTQQDSFLRLAHSKMDELETKYRERVHLFSNSSQTYVIYATFQRVQTCPEQVDIFRERLNTFGLRIIKESSYERSPASLMNKNRPEGTVWVVRPDPNRPTVVYVEDKIVSPASAGKIAAVGSSSSQSMAESPAATLGAGAVESSRQAQLANIPLQQARARRDQLISQGQSPAQAIAALQSTLAKMLNISEAEAYAELRVDTVAGYGRGTAPEAASGEETGRGGRRAEIDTVRIHQAKARRDQLIALGMTRQQAIAQLQKVLAQMLDISEAQASALLQ